MICSDNNVANPSGRAARRASSAGAPTLILAALVAGALLACLVMTARRPAAAAAGADTTRSRADNPPRADSTATTAPDPSGPRRRDGGHPGRPGPAGGGWWGGGGDDGGGFAPRWLGRLAKGFGPMPTEQQWKQAEAFFQDKSPKRLEAYRKLPDKAKDRKRGIKALVYAHYTQLKKLDMEDPPLYELKLKQIGLEDEIFGMLTGLNESRPPDAADSRDALREQVRPKVAALVDLGLEERRMRIERRQLALDKQKAELEEAKSKRDDLIARRINAMVKPPPRRHRGPGRPDHERKGDRPRDGRDPG